MNGNNLDKDDWTTSVWLNRMLRLPTRVKNNSLYLIGVILSTFLRLIAFPLKLTSITLWLLHKWLEGGVPARASEDYPDLSPTSDPEHVSVCSKALEIYLNRSGVMNIAITAPYAGGKTSFINHFFKHRPYRIQTVSLATFIDRKKKGKGKLPPPIDEFLSIEQSILQQLVQSSYRALFTRYLWSALLIISVIACYYIYVENLSIINIIQAANIREWRGVAALIVSVLILSFAILIVKEITTLYQTYRLRKINLAIAEFEIDHVSPSLLNNNLNDLREHFLRNPKDVVIFEDLDRFRRQDIFLKLREINKLLNDSLPVLRSPIKFIYAVADDVFEHRNHRTKFFDAIVSLVPVTNSHKSLALLRRAICKVFNDETQNLLGPVIEKVAVYINDMRLLNNIVADYKITSETLRLSHGSVPDPVNLFAFTVYKNYYPDDFSLLHDNKGFLYDSLSRETLIEFRKKLAKDATINLEKISANITRLENEEISSTADLNKIYFSSFYMRCTTKYGTINSIEGVSPNNYFNKISTKDYRKGAQVKVSTNNQGMKYEQIVLPEEMDKYVERYNNIDKKSDIVKYRISISKLQREINFIKKSSMAQLLEKYPEEGKCFLENRKKNFPELLFVLLRYGYLDERYSIYTTHSHNDDDLSGNDAKLLRCIMSASSPIPELELNNLPKLIERIHGHDWESNAIINYDLVDYFLSSPDVYDRLGSILDVIADSELNVKHFAEIWRRGVNTEKLIHKVVEGWEGIYGDILPSTEIDDNDKCGIILDLLPVSHHVHGQDFIGSGEASSVAHYLSEISYLFDSGMNEENSALEKHVDMLKLIHVEFKDLTVCSKNPWYLETCVVNNLYEFNSINIKKISEFASGDTEIPFDNDFSWFSHTRFNIVRERMFNEISTTVKLLANKEFVVSDLNDIYSILECEDITSHEIGIFIANLNEKIEWKYESQELEKILVPLIEENKVVVNWKLMKVLSESGLDEVFEDFANNHANELAELLSQENLEEHRMLRELLPIENLSKSSFEAYFYAIDTKESDMAQFTSDQALILINLNKIETSMACLESVIKYHPNLVVAYIEKYSDQLLNEGPFNANEIDDALVPKLLASESVAQEFKDSLFDNRRESLEFEYWRDDLLAYLVSRTKPIKLELEEIVEILDNTNDVNGHINLVTTQLTYFEGNERELLSEVDEELNQVLNRSVQGTVPYTEFRVALCEQLKKQNVIKHYSEKYKKNKRSIVVSLCKKP